MKENVNLVNKKRIFLSVIGVLVLLAGYDAWYQWNHLIVTVEHRVLPATAPKDIEIAVRGDKAFIDALSAGERKTVALRPSGGSNLIIRIWIDGKLIEERTFGCGVLPSGGYRADIVIDSKGIGDRFWRWPLEQPVSCF